MPPYRRRLPYAFRWVITQGFVVSLLENSGWCRDNAPGWREDYMAVAAPQLNDPGPDLYHEVAGDPRAAPVPGRRFRPVSLFP